MNINYKEPQFELFPANSATLEDINKPKFLLATLTLTTESLVILLVLAIMIALFSFSLGVERGKRSAAQAIDDKVSAAWNVGGRRLAAAPTPAVAAVTPTMVQKPVAKTVVAARMPMMPKANMAKTAPVAVKPGNAGFVRSAVTAPVAVKWTVQVATYKSENYAQQEALGLKAKGFPVFLMKSKDFYLVCVGQYGSQTQADSFLKKIQAKYQGSQVRRF